MFYEMDLLFIINNLMFVYLEILYNVLFVFLFNFNNYNMFHFEVLSMVWEFYKIDY